MSKPERWIANLDLAAWGRAGHLPESVRQPEIACTERHHLPAF